MTLAQERLAQLIEWFVASSAQRRQPCGGPVPVGPYAVVVPVEDMDAPPPFDHDTMALVLYVPAAQADGVWLPTVDLTDPASQGWPDDRLWHLIWRVENDRLALPYPWRDPEAAKLPPVAIIALDDPLETFAAALDRVGVDVGDDVPVVMVPLWAMPRPKGRAQLSAKLPFLPS